MRISKRPFPRSDSAIEYISSHKSSAYGIHPSQSLHQLYQVKNYQGANPEDAKILFVGRDPNWHFDLENMPLFEKVTEYLSDGVGFWKKYSIHHPFLLADYKGDGKEYQFRIKANLDEKASYVYTFKTTGERQTIEIPLHQMEPTYRGNKLDQPNFNSDKIQEIRILIGNGKAENFRLEIDRIELQKK